MLIRDPRGAGAVLLTLLIFVAACAPEVVKDDFEEKVLHSSAEQRLVVRNATNQALTLLFVEQTDRGVALPAGEVESFGFRVDTIAQIVPMEGDESADEPLEVTVNLLVATTEPVILDTVAVGLTGLTAVTSDGSEWRFRYDLAECRDDGWEAGAAPAADHRLDISGRPSILAEPLCPRR